MVAGLERVRAARVMLVVVGPLVRTVEVEKEVGTVEVEKEVRTVEVLKEVRWKREETDKEAQPAMALLAGRVVVIMTVTVWEKDVMEETGAMAG
jgi:hypothetical protein